MPRENIMKKYLTLIADTKERLTLQNMQMLINKDLIPTNMLFYKKLFLFNKFLKTCKEDVYYKLNTAAIDFINNNFELDMIDNGDKILQRTWDNMYKKAMEPMRVYLKEHKDEVLNQLNNALYNEVADKYAKGNISTWEMESISFYYHNHELANFQKDFDNFFALPEEPEIEYSFTTNSGQEIKIYKIHTIIGTVIDKDKVRNTVTLLTPTGVVLVRIYKNQFAIYDKQVSVKDNDGKKHVIEASWFKKGTLLRIQGIRRENDFIPKKTKSSIYPIIMKITNISNGYLEYQEQRMEVDE